MVNQVLVRDSPATSLDSNSFSWHDTTQEGDPTKGMSLRVSVEQENMSKGSMFSWYRTTQAVDLNKGAMLKVNVEQECMSTGGQDDSDSDLEGLLDSDAETFEGEPIDKEVLKRYLKQVKESEGFDIQDYPGLIEGVTCIIPLRHPIEDREDFPEYYKKIMDMAALAMGTYKKQNGTNFKVAEIEQVNYRVGRVIVYYITFSAVDVKSCDDEKGSLGSLLSNQLANIAAGVQIFTVTLSALLSIPWHATRLSLLKKQLELKSAPHKASLLEVLYENASRKTFQAVVTRDCANKHIEVKLCRTAA